MPNTMTLIASSTVGAGGASSIDFNSIPQTYTDLLLKVSCQTNRNGIDTLRLIFNSSTSSYSGKVLYASNTTPASFTGATAYGPYLAANGTNFANVFASIDCYIPNYTSTSTNKSFSTDSVAEATTASEEMALSAGLWSNTSAITSISLVPNVGSAIQQYSTAYLYGIKNS